jgi:hypothetical protein
MIRKSDVGLRRAPESRASVARSTTDVGTADLTPPKLGRPATRLRREVVKEIIDRVTCGETLRRILPDQGRPAHLPPRAVFLRAVTADTPAGITVQYAQARQALAMEWAEEVLELSDAPVATMIELNHARLRVDSRKWLLSKVLPKLYGDKLEVPLGTVALPYPVVALPPLDPRPGRSYADTPDPVLRDTTRGGLRTLPK